MLKRILVSWPFKKVVDQKFIMIKGLDQAYTKL